MSKPIVAYKKLEFCQVGRAAIVLTESHHRLETENQWRITSPVVLVHGGSINGKPVFETGNTVYSPEIA